MQPYQRNPITPLKEIPYQPYILRKYNIQPQKPYNEDNSGSNIIKPEYPFINQVYNIQNRRASYNAMIVKKHFDYLI